MLRIEKPKLWCILAEIDPLYDVIRGIKTQKMSFLDPILTFFNQSQKKNLLKLLKMEKHKFWCILAEIDPLYDVIMGDQNVQKSPFLTKIDHFSINLNETWQKY